MSEGKKFTRWYERHPKLAKAVQLLIILPDEIRSMMGEAMMLLANREFDAFKHMEASRLLGEEKVLGLFKSKSKLRDYDKNATLHKAMNYLYILSEENQDLMADHILKLLEYIQRYFASCQEFKADSSLEEVATITKTYVESGSDEVEVFLKSLRERFFTGLLQTEHPENQKVAALLSGANHSDDPQKTASQQNVTDSTKTADRQKKVVDLSAKVIPKDESGGKGMKIKKLDID